MGLITVLVDSLRAAVSVEAAVFALAAVGLNLHFGYTGLLNFGHAAFLLVGAYGAAVAVTTFGWSLASGLVVAIVVACLLAAGVGALTLRLRGDYLAITTIAVAELLRLLARSEWLQPLTGGVFGRQQFAGEFYALNPIPNGTYGLGRFSFTHRDLWATAVTWLVVGLAVIAVRKLMRSPWGRVILAVREDEDAARASGKNVFAFKLQSLALGGVIGALGGAMLAVSNQSVTPDAYSPVVTFYAFTIVVLGGAARSVGPVVGSAVFWFLLALSDGLLRLATATPGRGLAVVLQPADVGAVRLALVGGILLALMAWRPQGLLGRDDDLVWQTLDR